MSSNNFAVVIIAWPGTEANADGISNQLCPAVRNVDLYYNGSDDTDFRVPAHWTLFEDGEFSARNFLTLCNPRRVGDSCLLLPTPLPKTG